jgi:hypothetical protein
MAQIRHLEQKEHLEQKDRNGVQEDEGEVSKNRRLK